MVKCFEEPATEDFARRRTLTEVETVEAGLIQRVKALNLFLQDIYNGQHILADGVVPQPLIFNHPAYHRQVHRVKLPRPASRPISGSSLRPTLRFFPSWGWQGVSLRAQMLHWCSISGVTG